MATKRKVISPSANSTPPARPKPATARTTVSRPASPSKIPSRARNDALSPTFKPRAQSTVRTTLRSQTPNSAPGTPELRNRSLTTTSESASRYANDSRTRQGSVSLHHAVSFSSLQVSNASAVSPSPRLFPFDQSPASDQENTMAPTIRIRSKVTGIAKSASDSPVTSSSTRTPKSHSRTPSVTSATPPTSPPIPQFYPITTATPAANPHRFATVRTSPPTSHPPYLPFLRPNNDPFMNHARINPAKIDPTSIPLPPHSPPNSALSFSSRSSVSQSSASYAGDSAASSSASTHQELGNNQQLRATLDSLVHYTSMNSADDNWSGDSGQDRDTDGGEDTEERKVKAEAKSNRKIADLEITNRSLLSINASLEATKHRQAKEIRELRRKLRESRLILPPPAYRAVKSSLGPDDIADDEEDGEEDEDDEGTAVEDGDEIYKRIKAIIEGLLASGKRALERQETEGGKGGAKVLSAEEVRTWQGSSGDMSDPETHSAQDAGTPLPRLRSKDLDDVFTSEDEVEAMTLLNNSPLQSPGTPPILITESA